MTVDYSRNFVQNETTTNSEGGRELCFKLSHSVIDGTLMLICNNPPIKWWAKNGKLFGLWTEKQRKNSIIAMCEFEYEA